MPKVIELLCSKNVSLTFVAVRASIENLRQLRVKQFVSISPLWDAHRKQLDGIGRMAFACFLAKECGAIQ